LLQAYFGRDGREEAEELLQRYSGSADHPRILGAFNEPTPDWLSFFMFAYFTDRDGKYQLASLAESGFDPLSRTCRFMLTEEAHHLFVGEMGVARTVERTCELMKQHRTQRVSEYGGIDLGLLQRYLNLHYSVSLDLFGSEISTNAANYYSAGLKGRFREQEHDDDHVLTKAECAVVTFAPGRIEETRTPALLAINEGLREDYVRDSSRGLARWNKIIRDGGVDFELKLPHRGFNRRIGTFADAHVSPEGEIMTGEEWAARRNEWLPSPEDREVIAALMKPVAEPGKFASWIAPPARGINHQPADFTYVRFSGQA
jgi:benzoyl-CoA 2,3-dioxygenase component B